VFFVVHLLSTSRSESAPDDGYAVFFLRVLRAFVVRFL